MTVGNRPSEGLMNRREFVNVIGRVGAGSSLATMISAAGARLLAQGPPGLLGSATVRPEWLDRRKEPALEPELPIIDPHHHLWVRPGWRYMLDDFLADTRTGHNIVATVFVQANSMYRDSGPVEMR